MENVLDKCLTPTTEMISGLIEIENSHINTNHPDFVGSAEGFLNLFQDEDEDDTDPSNHYNRKSKQFNLMDSRGSPDDFGADIIDDPSE